MIKDLKYMKINSANFLYFIINKVNGYCEKINENKYLILVPTNQSKEKILKMKNCAVKSQISLVQ